jgi:stage II sporulation protein D
MKSLRQHLLDRHHKKQTTQPYQNILRQSKKAILHNRIKGWGMVFFMAIAIPYIISVFWTGHSREDQRPYLSSETDSRIWVERTQGNGIMRLSMEEYLWGALAAVIPAEYELECLKAQAILLRTSLIKQYRDDMTQYIHTGAYLRNPRGAYLSGTELIKLWGSDYEVNMEKMKQAVRDTRGIYLTYEDVPLEACFFWISGGQTRDGQEVPGLHFPYLKSVECPKDYTAADYMEEVAVNNRELERMLGGRLGEIQRDNAGYCIEAGIYLADGTKASIGGEALRLKLGLPSACFSVEREDKKVRFMVKGKGHGLGFCQYAANEMCKEGKDCNAVLSYFLSDIEFDKYE